MFVIHQPSPLDSRLSSPLLFFLFPFGFPFLSFLTGPFTHSSILHTYTMEMKPDRLDIAGC